MPQHQRSIIMAIFQWTKLSLGSLLSAKSPAAHRSDHKPDPLFFWMPVLLSSIASLALFSVSGWDLNTLMMSTALLLASLFIGRLLHQRHSRIIEQLLQDQEKLRTGDAAFYRQVLPIWSKQINTSRQTGDNSVSKLAVIFGDIVSRLKSVLKSSDDSSRTDRNNEKSFLETVSSSQTDIQTIFKDLKAALEAVNDSKDMLLAEVTMYSASMRDMAVESHHVAFQSQIIALNAEIEAARAGEAGRAFAAVVSEMRHLARQSGETSKKMTNEVESIDNAMVRFYNDDKEMEAKEALHISSAETMFNNILKNFNQVTLDMEKSISTMENESLQVRNDISSALMALQFQDSVSQIMAHVADNINALSEIAGTGTKNLDAETWLKDMKENFSVDAEHDNLSDSQTASTETSSLTFF